MGIADNGSTKANYRAEKFAAFVPDDNQADLFLHHDINQISHYFVLFDHTWICIYGNTTVKKDKDIFWKRKIKSYNSKRINLRKTTL